MGEQRISAMVVTDGAAPVGILTERDAVLMAYRHQNPEQVTVGEIMGKPLLTAPPEMDYREAYLLMADQRVRHLVVVDDAQKLVGIVTEGDFLKHLETDFLIRLKEVGAVMTHSVVTLSPDATLADAVSNMTRERISCVVIEQAGKPLGIFTERDLIRLEIPPDETDAVPLARVMTQPVRSVAAEDSLPAAIADMDAAGTRRLVVVDADGFIIGLITRSDIVKQLYSRHLGHLLEQVRQRDLELERVHMELRAERELRKAEAALAASEERYRTLFESLPLLIWQKDRDSVYKLCNENFADAQGLNPEELIGLTDQKLFPPDLAEKYRSDDLRIMESGEPEDFEEAWIERGQPRFVRTIKLPLKDEQGQVTGTLGIAEDITGRKQTERALEQSELRMALTMNTLPTGVMENDTEGAITYANMSLHGILGLKPGELIGRRVWEFVEDAEAADRVRAYFAYLIKEQPTPAPRVVDSVREEGGRVTLEITWDYKRDDMGEVVGFISAVTNITERRQAEKGLRERESYQRALLDNFPFLVWLKDTESRFLAVNRPFAESAGFTDTEQLKGKSDLDIWPHELAETYRADDQEVMANRTQKELEEEVTDRGAHRWFETYKAPVTDETGELLGTVGFARDITERKQADEYRRLTAKVFESTAEGVIVTDPAGDIVDVNRAFTEITGYGKEEVIGQNPKILNSGRHDIDFYRTMWQSLEESGRWHGEIWDRRKDGGLFPVWQTISSVTDENGVLTHYVSVFTDISHIKHSQQQLDHLAHHDALTDLPNRLLLNERLEQAIRRAERHGSQLAVIFLDLDNFKHINDSLGHPAGDRLLQIVANYLQDSVRQEDTVARIGGDEFVALMEDIGRPANAGIAAEKLMSIFDEPIQLEGREIGVSASLGISLYPRDGVDPSMLLRNADAAMYRAKAEGRNAYQFYTAELTLNAFERIFLESSLRLAIDREELLLLYQPQVDLRSGKITGVEALIRWEHPELGIVSPVKFIPMAEECGLIFPIGNWVLRNACQQAKVWMEQGLEFGRMSINIAGPQIQRGDLVQQVERVLIDIGLPACCVELEVTEGFIMREAEHAIKQLKKLGDLGITLAIDDFGTGYSSLNYLKQLPIHKLKIDQSFVRDIPDDPNDVAISTAVVAMGKSLGLTVIAEGVENEDQERFLREMGCEEVQGYRYSRPVTPEELEQLLTGAGIVPVS
jgi:diguanylate cyclase (GGDEF)-like protein/PAS domain S-box-containing protein